MGGITCVVTFISPLLVQPQEKPEKMKSHGDQISQGAKEKALPFVRNIT